MFATNHLQSAHPNSHRAKETKTRHHRLKSLLQSPSKWRPPRIHYGLAINHNGTLSNTASISRISYRSTFLRKPGSGYIGKKSGCQQLHPDCTAAYKIQRLSQKQWTTTSRLQAEVEHFGATMKRWELKVSASCYTTVDTKAWLASMAQQVWWQTKEEEK